MPKNKNIPINYVSRDFGSIKEDLIKHAKRYYPQVYRDFSEASFGSFLMDIVSYVGDNLSYYVDFQANESFMDTAIELDNIRRHARTLGYEYASTKCAYGTVSLFILVPSNTDGSSPTSDYIPILRKGASFSSPDGTSFILLEDVDFSRANNDIVAAKFNDITGNTTFYAIRAYAQVRSGKNSNITVDLTNEDFSRFRKVRIGENTITDIISCVDSEGNEWYQVENLSQEIVYKDFTNPTAKIDGVPSILKPIIAARRFVVERTETGLYAQFGHGNENSDKLTGILDPSRVAISLHGRRNITNNSFDPNELISNNKLGLSPSGKKLHFSCSLNEKRFTGVPANSINSVNNKTFYFENKANLDGITMRSVISSLEVTNPDPIVGDATTIGPTEIKQRARATYARQGRVITAKDYESLVYQMPGHFGSVRRCAVIGDPRATNKMVSLYVISEDSSGHLVSTNKIIKQNVKSWLSKYRPLNDVVEILDPKVVNFGIEFHAVSSPHYDQSAVMSIVLEEIKEYFSDILDIGEPIYINRLWSVINKVDGIVDLKKLKIFNLKNGKYSNITLDFDKILSRDGTYIKTPKNVIMELKYPSLDIKGVIK
tara:strand:+ start:21607 stop:23409 length:1803 start_codon:yes stop_codon:yes gene_type:complete